MRKERLHAVRHVLPDCEDAQGQKLLCDETVRPSARGYHRVLHVTRTLADLDGADRVGKLHIAEAAILSRAR